MHWRRQVAEIDNYIPLEVTSALKFTKGAWLRHWLKQLLVRNLYFLTNILS